MPDVLVPEQSLRDIQRRRWAQPLVPYVLTLPCPVSGCEGVLYFTGRSSKAGTGPLINIHTCDRCGGRADLADDYYPRIEYRNHDGRPVDMATGRAVPR